MTLNEDQGRAILLATGQRLLGIEQVDAELCAKTGVVLLYGDTADPDVTYIASVPLPEIHWKRA